MAAKCVNPNHEHTPRVNKCHECGRPNHYDLRVKDYRHNDDSRCFLSKGANTPCVPAA